MSKDIPTIRTTPQQNEIFIMQIPECCREGHPDCPHAINKPVRERKKNIGL